MHLAQRIGSHTDRKMGLFSAFALSNASCPHSYQSTYRSIDTINFHREARRCGTAGLKRTGLSACCSRYGLFACANRFIRTPSSRALPCEVLIFFANELREKGGPSGWAAVMTELVCTCLGRNVWRVDGDSRNNRRVLGVTFRLQCKRSIERC